MSPAGLHLTFYAQASLSQKNNTGFAITALGFEFDSNNSLIKSEGERTLALTAVPSESLLCM